MWFIVYNADVRMRAERFQRLRRHAEHDHTAALAAGRRSNFDLARPWDTVFSMADADKNWWEENMHRAALLYLARVKTAAQVLDDRTAQPALEGTSPLAPSLRAPPDSGSRRSGRSRTPPRDSGGRNRTQGGDGAVFTKKGKRFCDDFNTPRGCSKGKACQDLHACKLCKKFGHPMHKCGRGPDDAPPPPASRGQQGGSPRRRY